MSLSKLKSGNSDQFQNGSRPSGSLSVSVACRVCHRVFFDNTSLVLHFESHVNDGLKLRGREPSFLRSGQRLSSSQSPNSHSSLVRMNWAYDVNDYVRFSSWLAKCAKNRNFPNIPVMNVTPSVSPSYDNDKNAPISQLEKPDEEGGKSTVEMDLALKLSKDFE